MYDLSCLFDCFTTNSALLVLSPPPLPTTVPSVSLDSDQLIVMESDEVASVCATISNVPGGGLDCPIILSLSAAPGNNKPGNFRCCR